MTAGDGRGRKFTVNGRPIRPSPSGLKKDGAVPSWLRTDGTVDNTASNLGPARGVQASLPEGNEIWNLIFSW